MSNYIPLHDRPPYYASLPTPPRALQPPSPRYASPDLDPSQPYPWTRQALMSGMMDPYETGEPSESDEIPVPYTSESLPSHTNGQPEAGPSRKRHRPVEAESNGHHTSSRAGPAFTPRPRPSASSSSAHSQSHHRSSIPPDMPIVPTIFGLAPRNEFTKTVGNFIMANATGQEHVEIEIKLGMLMAPIPNGQPAEPRRIRMPTMTEMIIPVDYPVGSFRSDMTKKQNYGLNQLLNEAVERSVHAPSPLHFFRARHIDSFHGYLGPRQGKARVSRDREGNVILGGVVVKKRLADLNVYSPNEMFDWRVSVSTETPCEMPISPPNLVREKDRACYKHQLCQVDLTVVTARPDDPPKPVISYELEIEILDVPALLAEGSKEASGDANRFDEMLQSVLDTARMLIRNCPDPN